MYAGRWAVKDATKQEMTCPQLSPSAFQRGDIFPVEECDGKVDGDLHAVAGTPPHEVHAQGLLVPREAQGPSMMAISETNSQIGIIRICLPNLISCILPSEIVLLCKKHPLWLCLQQLVECFANR